MVRTPLIFMFSHAEQIMTEGTEVADMRMEPSRCTKKYSITVCPYEIK